MREIEPIVRKHPEAITDVQLVKIIYDGLNRTEVDFKTCARILINVLPRKTDKVTLQDRFSRYSAMQLAFERYDDIQKPEDSDDHNSVWHKKMQFYAL